MQTVLQVVLITVQMATSFLNRFFNCIVMSMDLSTVCSMVLHFFLNFDFNGMFMSTDLSTVCTMV